MTLVICIPAIEEEQKMPNWLTPAGRKRQEELLAEKEGRKPPRPTDSLDPAKVQAIRDKYRQRRSDAGALSQERFNPYHEPAGSSVGGQFAEGPGGGGKAKFSDKVAKPPKTAVAFVSPNVSTNMKFKDAAEAFGSEGHGRLEKASKAIDKAVGITPSEGHNAIGAWADGAENTLSLKAGSDASPEQFRVAAAMKGYIADQKSVLVFAPDENGEHVLGKFHAEGDLEAIHVDLLKKDIAFHTIQPTGTGADIYVLAMDQETLDTVAVAAESYGSELEGIKGNGEFVGTSKEDGTDREQRDDARREYEKVIADYAASPEHEAVAEAWGKIRADWDSVSDDPEKVAVAAEKRPVSTGTNVESFAEDYAVPKERPTNDELEPTILANRDLDARHVVMSKGAEDGFEHLAVLSPDRAPEVFTSNSTDHVMPSAEAIKEFMWSAKPGSISAHHNHPLAMGLSAPDLNMAGAMQGLDKLYAHTADGIYGAGLSKEMRKGSDIGRQGLIRDMIQSASESTFAFLNRGQEGVVPSDAMIAPHLRAMLLKDAGVFDYVYEFTPKREKIMAERMDDFRMSETYMDTVADLRNMVASRG